MVGNIFWNMFAISFRCIPSPEKLFITMRGDVWYAFCKKYCFLRLDMTSLVKQKSSTLKVSVGPRGNRDIFKYRPNFVILNIHK